MKLHRLEMMALMASMLAWGAANATDVIYSNFASPTESPYDSSSSRDIGPLTTTENGTGYSFNATKTASVSEIDLLLWASPDTSISATLTTAVPGCGTGGYSYECTGQSSFFGTSVPGATLGAWQLSFQQNPADSPSDKTTRITNISGITLTAGTDYFLILATPQHSTASSSVAWSDNIVGATSNLWQCGGHTDFTFTTCVGSISYANVTNGALTVLGNVSTVPEPDQFALMFAGFAVVGTATLRKRKSDGPSPMSRT